MKNIDQLGAQKSTLVWKAARWIANNDAAATVESATVVLVAEMFDVRPIEVWDRVCLMVARPRRSRHQGRAT